MNINQFENTYVQFGSRDIIIIQCHCGKDVKIYKCKAKENIEKNGQFVCRCCRMAVTSKDRVYTIAGRKKISEATSYKRSEETKLKMSESAVAKYNTPEGEKLRLHLSRLAAKGHATNKFNKSKRHGLFFSNKNQTLVAYNSSYELRYCVELENDPEVVGYQTQIYYEVEGRGRSLDFLVEYKNKIICAIELKPISRLTEQATISQFKDSHANAEKNGWEFRVYTELHFGMKYKEIRDWADAFRQTLTGIDYAAHRNKLNNKKAKRHYDAKIATNTIEVFCPYCQTTHTALRLTHDKNIARNGRYICEKEGGHIAGSKPKKKKINPYSEQGMKQCTKCQRILPIPDCFGLDKSRSDGYSNKCRECRK